MIRVAQRRYELCTSIHQHPKTFVCHASFGGRNISFLVCHVASCDHVVVRHATSRVRYVTVIHQLAKFDGHRHCQKGSVTLSHLSQEHPLRHCQANLWLHGRASSPQVTNLPCLVVRDLAEEEILIINYKPSQFGGPRPAIEEIFCFYFVTCPYGQSVMWLYGYFPLVIGLHPAKLGGHRRKIKWDILFLVDHVTSRDHVIRRSSDIMGEFSYRK